MPRLKPVYKPSDHPNAEDPATKAALAELFDYYYPGNPDPQFPRGGAGFAIAALSPKMALPLVKVARFMITELEFSKREDLKELAIQAMNLRLGCDFGWEAHIPIAKRAGISPELLSAIPFWRTSTMFDDEQRLVIEYADAVSIGDVSDELFARVVAVYGEQGTVEFTALVSWWAFWARILTTVRPSFKDAD